MRLSILEAARSDLRSAFAWYREQRPGLERALTDDVRATLRAVREHPMAGSPVQGAVRRRLLSRFPYALLYQVEDDVALIVAFMHQRRDPEAWSDRVEDEG